MIALTDWFDRLGPASPQLEVEVPEGWGQGRATFGGLVAGLALRAAEACVEPDRCPRSAQVTFVGPVRPGPARAEATVLRAGRAMTLVRAVVLQDGGPRTDLVAAFGAARPTAIGVDDPGRPDMGLVEQGLDFPYIPGLTPDFTRGFEYRWDPAVLPFSGSSEARVDGAVRIRGADRVDATGVLALLDAWPAPVLALASAPIFASTVTWQVNFTRAVPEGGWPGDGFWRYRSESQACGEGYADMDSRLWAPDGTLVAAGRQLVAEFSAR